MARKQINMKLRLDLVKMLDEVKEMGEGYYSQRSRTWLVEEAVEEMYRPMLEELQAAGDKEPS